MKNFLATIGHVLLLAFVSLWLLTLGMVGFWLALAIWVGGGIWFIVTLWRLLAEPFIES